MGTVVIVNGMGGAGGGGAPSTAPYITQTPDATLSGEQALSTLASGLLVNTTGTGVLSALSTPSYAYGVLISDPSATGGFRWCKQFISDDFWGFQNSGTSSQGPFGFEAFLTGAGAGISAVSATDAGRYGYMSCTTGTTTTGLVGLMGGGGSTTVATGSLLLGTDAFEFMWSMKSGANLSDGTETYQISMGFIDDSAGGLGTDAVGFRYTHTENSGAWVAYTRSNSVESVINSGVTFEINTLYDLVAKVNAAATNVEFFINGTSLGSITTNIPTGANRQTAPRASMLKSAGTTARLMTLDKFVLAIG